MLSNCMADGINVCSVESPTSGTVIKLPVELLLFF